VQPQIIRETVRHALAAAYEDAVASGALPGGASEAQAQAIEVSRPSDPAHGDYASNLALKLARPLRRPPLAIAEAIAPRAVHPAIASVEVAPPGFLNVRLSTMFLAEVLDAALAAGDDYGRLAPTATAARRLNVEFVSANPTGPLHIGNARGAFVGDLLCRVLEAAGDTVTREYYFNDFGSQVRNLGASVRARREGRPAPEDGYHGGYVDELAAALPSELLAGPASDAAAESGAASGSADDATDLDLRVGAWASEQVRAGIEASLARLGVHFDVWKSEGSLYSDGHVEAAIERLAAAKETYEQDGALWFRSTDYGDDKDRVLRRSNGQYTYFGSDVGYLVDKFGRGFDELIYLWGADHHGTVARLRNAAEAMGFGAERVRVLLIAWVRFVRDGREISMSKRAGEYITLDELLAEIGVDAARWFFAARGHTVGIDFDIELAKRQSNENPVYYVQYAHARISSILRKAAEAGLEAAPTLIAQALSADPIAFDLALRALRLPEVVQDAAAAQETQGLTTYATDLATAFHAFYRDRRVVDAGDPVTSALRLRLVSAVRLALANTLALMGISAPESM
jgi:arginyl-tRNA synthetase